MIDERFVYLGALIGLAGSFIYARETARGNNQPNRMTFILWALAPLLGFVVQMRLGVGHASVLTLVIGVGPLMVLAASFTKSSATWSLGPFDYACGILSLVGLVVWVLTGEGVAAIVLFVGADLLAGLPTVAKAWKAPETESPSLFLASLINGLITMATLDELSVEAAAFPIYLVVLSGVVLYLIRLRPRRPSVPAAC